VSEEHVGPGGEQPGSGQLELPEVESLEPAEGPPQAGAADRSAAPPEVESAPGPGSASGEAERPRRARNSTLVRAFRSGRPVEGTIERVIKGGYEVRVGRARGFCPHSQVDLHREDQPERHVGQTYAFRVTQLRRGGDDVVLSRRALLEEERVEEAKAVRATLVEGAITQGRVAGTAEFGAFIDLGAGVLGLAHISELSHDRIKRVEDAVKVGDTVRVRVLKVDEGQGRISLSVRRAVEDPWSGVAERFGVGRVYPGTVRRLADFGAFVELAPGVEALAPASEFPPQRGGWREGLVPGQSRPWFVLSVDPEGRRISVTPPGEDPSGFQVSPGAELKGRVQRVERYGVFAWLCPGKIGLIPRDWTGAPAGADLRRSFQVGDPVEVSVIELAEDGRRIRLAVKGAQASAAARPPAPGPAAPRPAAPRPAAPAEAPSTFGTSLADKLRAALNRREPG
jgi:small subunit ribosomal protein S1